MTYERAYEIALIALTNCAIASSTEATSNIYDEAIKVLTYPHRRTAHDEDMHLINEHYDSLAKDAS